MRRFRASCVVRLKRYYRDGFVNFKGDYIVLQELFAGSVGEIEIVCGDGCAYVDFRNFLKNPYHVRLSLKDLEYLASDRSRYYGRWTQINPDVKEQGSSTSGKEEWREAAKRIFGDPIKKDILSDP